MEARLAAEASLVKSISLKARVVTHQSVTSDDSVVAPAFSEPEGFEDRMRGKVEQLTEAVVDKALVDLGEEVPPTAKLVEKRELYNNSITKKSIQSACEKVTGFYILTTMEATEEASGRVAVGVIIGRRNNALGWINEVARGGGAVGVPRQEPGRPLEERVAKDAAGLYDKFGVRVVADERGVVHVISYGQSAPDIRKGMEEEEVDTKIDTAETYAENDAINGMVEFLNSTLAWQRNVEEGFSKKKLQTVSAEGGQQAEEIGWVTDLIKKLRETTTRFSSADMKGVTPFRKWQGNHPEFGNPLVGCVVIWSPETAASAMNYKRPASAGNASGFKPKGGTPGVRSSSNEDPPKKEEPVVQAPASGSATAASQEGCDGTLAVGTGISRDSAVIDALEAAVRQQCGVAVASKTEVSERVATSLVDQRVNEACADMRSSFASTSLLSKDVSIRTRGLIKEYRVLSEETETDGRRFRVSICAQVAVFDPKNPRPGAKATLIVLPPTSRQDTYNCFGSRINATDVIRGLETELARDLFKIKAFTILERERLAAILGEQTFIASDLTKLQEKVKLGILSGGDLILISEIEDLLAVQDEKVIKLTGNRVVKRYGSAKINWRIVSVGTGEIVDQDTVSVPLDDEGFRQLGAKYPNAPVATALMSLASSRIAPEVALRAAPLRVAQVVGGTVFLNRGRETLKPGMEFAVYRQGVEMHDPNTGASLGRSESKVGMVKVERCEQDFSTATIVSGEIGTQDAGSMCRGSN